MNLWGCLNLITAKITEVTFVALLLLSILGLTGCETEIATGLSEKGSLKILSDLAEGGIPAKRRSEGKGKDLHWRILVDENVKTRAARIIGKLGVLASREDIHIDQESLLSDTESKRNTRERKLAISIQESLEALPGVRDAYVHLMLSEEKVSAIRDKFTEYKQHQSAAVLLTTYPKASINEDDVAQLIGGATGINEDAIAVVHNQLPGDIFSAIETPQTQILSDPTSDTEPREQWPNGIKTGAIIITSLVITALLMKVVGKLIRPVNLVISEEC